MQGEPNGSYDLMKSCIVSKDIDKLDEWMEGVVSSLFYRVNHKLLVLHGKHIGKVLFVESLLGADTQETLMARSKIYQSMIINLDEVKSRGELDETRRLLTNEGFMINDIPGEYASCEKRLSSFVTVITNPEKFIGAKRAICIEIEDIFWTRLENINKELLWVDIYNKFKNLDYGK